MVLNSVSSTHPLLLQGQTEKRKTPTHLSHNYLTSAYTSAQFSVPQTLTSQRLTIAIMSDYPTSSTSYGTINDVEARLNKAIREIHRDIANIHREMHYIRLLRNEYLKAQRRRKRTLLCVLGVLPGILMSWDLWHRFTR